MAKFPWYLLINFHPLEVVCRYRDPQLQVGENKMNPVHYMWLIILFCFLVLHADELKNRTGFLIVNTGLGHDEVSCGVVIVVTR